MSTPVYLDHNATTPLAPSVLDAISKSLSRDWANPGSTHAPGQTANAAMVKGRRLVADMLNATPDEIVFTSGGTEGSNMVILGLPHLPTTHASDTAKRPHVVTTNVEHDATILPLRRMRDLGQVDLTEVSVDDCGAIRTNDLLAAVRPTTRMVTLMLANNETGVIFPVKEIASRLRDINKERLAAKLPTILLHTDAAQAVGKIEVDVVDLGVDYLTLTGHKFYGPRFGCVFARASTPLVPLLFGGGQERGLRSGTPNVPMIAGLGEAARLVSENLHEYASKMAAARDLLERSLQLEFGNNVVFNCRHPDVPRLPNTSNISLVSPVVRGDSDTNHVDLRGHVVLLRCPGVLASVGACCHEQDVASTVLIRCGVKPHLAANAIRLSVGRDTTDEQIEIAVKQLKRAYDQIVQSA